MLWFWGLTEAERQAYIPLVGRVAGKTWKAPRKPRERRSDRRRKTLVGGTSPEHSQLSSRPLGPAVRAPDAAQIAADGKPQAGKAVGRPAADGRSVGQRMREPEVTAPTSKFWAFRVSGAPEARGSTTPQHHAVERANEPHAPRRCPRR